MTQQAPPLPRSIDLAKDLAEALCALDDPQLSDDARALARLAIKRCVEISDLLEELRRKHFEPDP